MKTNTNQVKSENPQAASYLPVKRPARLRLCFDQNGNFVGQIFEQKIAFLASVVFNRKTFNYTQLSNTLTHLRTISSMLFYNIYISDKPLNVPNALRDLQSIKGLLNLVASALSGF